MARSKPLSAPVLHIMLALAEGDRHGYAIKQEVEAKTDGSIRLGPGTLYEAIQRLEESGFIEETDPHADAVNGQEAQRRYYRLTNRGWTVLREELRSLGRIVDLARENPRLRKGLA